MDPWVQIDAAEKDRDAFRKEGATLKEERDATRKLLEKRTSENTIMKRALEEYKLLGTAEEFADAKRQVSAIPSPDNPKMAEDVIKSELEGSFRVLVGGTAPVPGGKSTQPVTDLDPDSVTLDGTPRRGRRRSRNLPARCTRTSCSGLPAPARNHSGQY